MKVLMITQYFPPDIGGSSTRAYNVARALSKKGFQVKVITAFPHYPSGKVPPQYKLKALTFEKIDDIEIIRVWIPSLPHNSIVNRLFLHLWFIFFTLFVLPFGGRVDIIFAANPNLFSFFPALISYFINRGFIVRNVDDLWPEVFYDMNLIKSNTVKKLLDFMAWLSYSVPVAITPISSGYKRRIIEKYGVRKNKIHVIEVGVDTSIFSNTTSNKKDDFIVMYSGVLGPAYDFTNILMAAKLLTDHDLSFVIRGIGECEMDIKKMIDEHSLENVILDTNIVSKGKFIDILSSADIFLLPMKEISAVEEGLPTKIFEYQAMGKPIVCCSSGEPAQYISKTCSGVVVPPNDHKGLANAILELYMNEEKRKTLGSNGHSYVLSNVSLEAIGAKMSRVFKNVVNTRTNKKNKAVF